MMAILNRHQDLPRDRADLYEQASRVLLYQWDTERTLGNFPGLSNEIGLREKTEILRRVEWHMQAGPGGLKENLIAGEALTELIEDYLCTVLHFDRARAAARTVVEHLRQRTFIERNPWGPPRHLFNKWRRAADYVECAHWALPRSIVVDGDLRSGAWHGRETVP